MSYRVTNKVLEESEAMGNDRLVLLAIAEIAHHDGAGWLPQIWDKTDLLEKRKRTIAWLAKCSERQVRRSIRELQALGELEARHAQDGRRRFLVYRITVGDLCSIDVDYARLPRLNAPFSTPAELALKASRRPDKMAGRGGDASANADHSRAGETRARRPARLAGAQEADDRTQRVTTTGHTGSRRPDTHARAEEVPSLEPSEEPSFSSSSTSAAAAAELRDSLALNAAAGLREELEAIGAGASLVELAWAEPERALAWIQLAKDEAARNRGGFVFAGMKGGEWPSPRHESSNDPAKRLAWAEKTSPLLDEEHALLIVDEWHELGVIDEVERQELVEACEAARGRLAEAAAEEAA